MPRPSSPRTRASSSGERSCTTKVMAAALLDRLLSPLPHGQHPRNSYRMRRHVQLSKGHPPNRLPGGLRGARRGARDQGHDGCPNSIGSPRSGRSAPLARAPEKWAFFNVRSVPFSVAIDTMCHEPQRMCGLNSAAWEWRGAGTTSSILVTLTVRPASQEGPNDLLSTTASR